MKPLQDLRILAIEQFGAGPFGSLHLADLGADVIKIEDARTGGDVSRYIPPFQEGEDSLFYETFNRNKRSLALDLSNDAGMEVLHSLVPHADAVLANLRGDVARRLGVTHAELGRIKPDIVCVNISAFGSGGSASERPGYDYLIQALTGWMDLTGDPDRPPAKSGLSLVDYSSGLVAALSLLAAVHQARRDGIGSDCDISLYDVAASMLTYPATWHLTAGWSPERLARSAHPSIVPFQLFRGSDDAWFMVACAKEIFWERLTVVIGRPELATDARYRSFDDRRDHRNELITELDAIFATRTCSAWVEALEAAAVPCAPVLDLPAALRTDLMAERGMIVETEHPRFGTVRQVRTAVRVGEADESSHRRAPALHEDASSILGTLLGLDEHAIADLRARGAFGSLS